MKENNNDHSWWYSVGSSLGDSFDSVFNFLIGNLTFIGILFASLVGGWYASKVARQRMTMDLLIKSDSDEFYRKIYQTFDSERSKGKDGKLIYKNLKEQKKKNKKDKEIQEEIISLLNFYELIAVGIKYKIVDKNIIKEYMKPTYLADFSSAENYLNGSRKGGHPEAWVEFEKLAKEWSKEKGR